MDNFSQVANLLPKILTTKFLFNDQLIDYDFSYFQPKIFTYNPTIQSIPLNHFTAKDNSDIIGFENFDLKLKHFINKKIANEYHNSLHLINKPISIEIDQIFKTITSSSSKSTINSVYSTEYQNSLNLINQPIPTELEPIFKTIQTSHVNMEKTLVYSTELVTEPTLDNSIHVWINSDQKSIKFIFIFVSKFDRMEADETISKWETVGKKWGGQILKNENIEAEIDPLIEDINQFGKAISILIVPQITLTSHEAKILKLENKKFMYMPDIELPIDMSKFKTKKEYIHSIKKLMYNRIDAINFY